MSECLVLIATCNPVFSSSPCWPDKFWILSLILSPFIKIFKAFIKSNGFLRKTSFEKFHIMFYNIKSIFVHRKYEQQRKDQLKTLFLNFIDMMRALLCTINWVKIQQCCRYLVEIPSLVLGLRDASVVNSTCCFRSESRFGPQNPHQAAPRWL